MKHKGFSINRFKHFIHQQTSKQGFVEIADAGNQKPKRAIVTYPLIHVGANLKNLYWLPEVLKKIAPEFRGLPFKYDLKGDKGSSHVPDNLFSPFFDVGWTYSDERGAWYDDTTQTMWVKGEVTHPEVVEKLARQTTDGKRELNYASMGVFIDPEQAINSVTNKKWNDEEEFVRGEAYNGKVCNLIPYGIKKALHVALTNDPADTEAGLAELAFAEGGIMDENYNSAKEEQTVPPEAFQVLAERVKAIETEHKEIVGNKNMEQNNIEQKAPMGPPQAPVAAPAPTEDEQAPPPKVETAMYGQNGGAVPPVEPSMGDIAMLLKQILTKLGVGTETADDMPATTTPKDNEIDAQTPAEPQSVGTNTLEKVGEGIDKGNAVNKAGLKKPDETSMGTPGLNAGAETADARMIRQKYTKKIIMEVADQTVRLGKHKDRGTAIKEFSDKSLFELEMLNSTLSSIPTPPQKGSVHFADNVPEFGGSGAPQQATLEVADMSAKERRKKFGVFGGYDVCFNPSHAPRYIGEE